MFMTEAPMHGVRDDSLRGEQDGYVFQPWEGVKEWDFVQIWLTIFSQAGFNLLESNLLESNVLES